jgi:hypothetical protein
VTVERSGKTGRPTTVFTVRGDSSGDCVPQPAGTEGERYEDTSRHAEVRPASAERAQTPATVVSLDAYRPEPQQTPEPAPEPKRPEPLGDTNPFLALL